MRGLGWPGCPAWWREARLLLPEGCTDSTHCPSPVLSLYQLSLQEPIFLYEDFKAETGCICIAGSSSFLLISGFPQFPLLFSLCFCRNHFQFLLRAFLYLLVIEMHHNVNKYELCKGEQSWLSWGEFPPVSIPGNLR